MHDLIKGLFVKHLSNPFLNSLGDSAIVKGNLAFTTDSFVVKPIFFPGGDIGKLSVCGTVNDLAVSGAVPKYLSCGMILEDGFSYTDLEKITISIKCACLEAGVKIVTGDFKVVEKGSVDKIFINTAGIGRVHDQSRISIQSIKPGDKVILTGTVADHAASILLAREKLNFNVKILSDAAPLNKLIASIICRDIKFMRDPTRGGVANTLNEISSAIGYNISISEKSIPIGKSVSELCEIMGFDPLYMANEGKALIIVSEKAALKILSKIKKHPLGKNAEIIGEIQKAKQKKVYLKTKIGTNRILDMLTLEQLPRIC